MAAIVTLLPKDPLFVDASDDEKAWKTRHDQHQSSRQTYEMYDSPCLDIFSNDELSVDFVNELPLCNTTFYGGCAFDDASELPADDGDNNAAIVPFDVEFDYELLYRKGADPIRTIHFVENIMVDRVASVVGVKECQAMSNALAAQNETESAAIVSSDGNRRLQRSAQHFERLNDRFLMGVLLTQEEKDRIVAVSSHPIDQIDPDHECYVPVPTSIAEGTLCRPITGRFRIFVDRENPYPITTESEWLALQSGVSRLIRTGMERGIYSTGNVRHVSFIGTRVNGNNSTEEDSTNGLNGLGRNGRGGIDTSGDGSISSRDMSLIVSSSTIVTLLLVFLAMLLVRRRRDSNTDEEEQEVDIEKADFEEGDSATLDPPGIHARQKNFEEDSAIWAAFTSRGAVNAATDEPPDNLATQIPSRGSVVSNQGLQPDPEPFNVMDDIDDDDDDDVDDNVPVRYIIPQSITYY